ncbi:MAG: T9SS type A sorting domain-containing protein [Muribaculaceae bacterium]|nr:T9SS type A sorting domain-containing protein [Muribaculaceae bacterium]
MKRNHITAFGWLTGLLISCYCTAKAQEAVPCLIFTGNSDTEYCIDLDKLNRLTFGDDGITVSSSSDSTQPEVTLLYSLFHHLEIGNASPTDPAGADAVEAESGSQLRYIADTRSIALDSSSEAPYSIGIFSLKGTLIASSKMSAGQTLSVGSLTAGTYIAVATNGNNQLTLKFIHR